MSLYVTPVPTHRKIDDDVLDIIPDILDSLQEALDNKELTKPRDSYAYIENMRAHAQSASDARWLGEKMIDTRRAIVSGLAALLNRRARKPVFKSPTGIKVNAEQVDESEGKDVGIVHADKGDWIVTNSDITGLVYSDDEFRLLFTLDEDESA